MASSYNEIDNNTDHFRFFSPLSCIIIKGTRVVLLSKYNFLDSKYTKYKYKNRKAHQF